jgi:hypothetical protein
MPERPPITEKGLYFAIFGPERSEMGARGVSKMGEKLLTALVSGGFFGRHPSAQEELCDIIADAAEEAAEEIHAEAIEPSPVAGARTALHHLQAEITARPVRVPRAAGEGVPDAGR